MSDRQVRPGTDSSDRLLDAGTATLGEVGGLPVDPAITAAWPGARLAGPAFTALCTHRDNLAAHAAVARAAAGDVLVLATAGERQYGYWGEILATGAQARGVVGLVTDGGVRDVAEIEGIGFPIFSAGVSIAGTVKEKGRATGCTVSVGGVDIEPGDWVVADRDGVVVVRRDEFEDVLKRAEQRLDNEVRYLAALREGATTIELLGLEASIERLPTS